jgi:hypothetical protein
MQGHKNYALQNKKLCTIDPKNTRDFEALGEQ